MNFDSCMEYEAELELPNICVFLDVDQFPPKPVAFPSVKYTVSYWEPVAIAEATCVPGRSAFTDIGGPLKKIIGDDKLNQHVDGTCDEGAKSAAGDAKRMYVEAHAYGVDAFARFKSTGTQQQVARSLICEEYDADYGSVTKPAASTATPEQLAKLQEYGVDINNPDIATDQLTDKLGIGSGFEAAAPDCVAKASLSDCANEHFDLSKSLESLGITGKDGLLSQIKTLTELKKEGGIEDSDQFAGLVEREQDLDAHGLDLADIKEIMHLQTLASSNPNLLATLAVSKAAKLIPVDDLMNAMSEHISIKEGLEELKSAFPNASLTELLEKQGLTGQELVKALDMEGFLQSAGIKDIGEMADKVFKGDTFKMLNISDRLNEVFDLKKLTDSLGLKDVADFIKQQEIMETLDQYGKDAQEYVQTQIDALAEQLNISEMFSDLGIDWGEMMGTVDFLKQFNGLSLASLIDMIPGLEQAKAGLATFMNAACLGVGKPAMDRGSFTSRIVPWCVSAQVFESGLGTYSHDALLGTQLLPKFSMNSLMKTAKGVALHGSNPTAALQSSFDKLGAFGLSALYVSESDRECWFEGCDGLVNLAQGLFNGIIATQPFVYGALCSGPEYAKKAGVNIDIVNQMYNSVVGKPMCVGTWGFLQGTGTTRDNVKARAYALMAVRAYGRAQDAGLVKDYHMAPVNKMRFNVEYPYIHKPGTKHRGSQCYDIGTNDMSWVNQSERSVLDPTGLVTNALGSVAGKFVPGMEKDEVTQGYQVHTLWKKTSCTIWECPKNTFFGGKVGRNKEINQ